MSDANKVITGLELCIGMTQEGCSMLCPYKDERDETYSGLCVQVLKHEALALLKEQQDEIQNLRKENNSILTQFHEWVKEQGKKTKELLQEIKDLRLTVSPATAGEIIAEEQNEGGKQE